MFDPRKINRFPGILTGGLAKMVPTWPVELDQSHPLGGMAALYIPGNKALIDLTGNGNILTGGSSQRVMTASGPGVYYSNIAGVADTCPLPASMQGPKFTIVWRGMLNSATVGSNGAIFGFSSPINGDRPGNLYNTGGSGLWGDYTQSGGNIQFGSIAAIPNIQVRSAAIVCATGAPPYGYYNGVLTLSSSQGNFVRPATYSGAIILLGGSSNTTTVKAAIYPTALSAALLAWENAEPFAMLRPIIRRQYYGAASLYPQSNWLMF